MTRPMSEEERAMVIAEARETLRRWQFIGVGVEPDSVRVARALLSTSSAERGMREAAEALNNEIDRMWNDVHRLNPPNWESHQKAICKAQQDLYAALSPKGGG